MDLFELDDLFQDEPMNKKLGSKINLTQDKQNQQKNQKKTNVDDDWGDLDFGDDVKPQQKKIGILKFNDDNKDKEPTGIAKKSPSTILKESNKNGVFGYGGPDGLRKESKKPDEEIDEWGDTDYNKGAGESLGRRSLLGRKPLMKNNDDDLDDVLDVLEAKRGINSTKEAEPPKPKTIQRPNTAALQRGNDDDELEDLGDGISKISGAASNRGLSNEALAAKRKALFGVGASAENNNANNPIPKSQRRAQTSVRPQEKPQIQNIYMQDQHQILPDGNASIGSQGSAIELIEVPNSRQRRMIKPPAGQLQKTNASSTGTNQGLNQIQELHQNNRLTRPETGNIRKPPRSGIHDGTGDEPGILELLDDSQNANSNAGSHKTAAGGLIALQNRLGSQAGKKENLIATVGSGVDFERDEDLDIDAEYGEQDYGSSDEKQDSDSDDGGFYQPTLIAKSSSKPKQSKKKKKQAVQGSKNLNTQKQNQLKSNNLIPMGSVNDLTSSAGLNSMGVITGKAAIPPGRGQNILSFQNQSQALSSKAIANKEQSKAKVRPNDTKGMLEFDIEQERERISQMETRFRNEIEKLRLENQSQINDLELKHVSQKKQLEQDKQKLNDDKLKAIEEERKKQFQLNIIDIENREIIYKKNLENQRTLFEDQQQGLRKQLQERLQINELAKQISNSSGNINSIIAQIGAANQGELQRREDEISRREKEVDSKRQNIQEKKLQFQQTKRKLQQEIDEIKSRENEVRIDYQREKSDITNELDRMEMDHMKEIRHLRDKTIDLEVEVKQKQEEGERCFQNIQQDDIQHKSKIQEYQLKKKSILQQISTFETECIAQENELKQKLQSFQDTMRDVIKEEQKIQKKIKIFEEENNKVSLENYDLKQELDKYCLEKEVFDQLAQQVKEMGEQDKIESEKISYFKQNKDKLYDDLKLQKQEIEKQKQQIREEKVKLELYKNEIKAQQKTVELLRYNYITGDQQDTVNKADYIQQAKNRQIPINPPISLQSNNQNSKAPLPLPQQNVNNLVQRFNYEGFMKDLQNKISGSSQASNLQSGAHFQAYLLRERESYLKSVQELQRVDPTVQSLAILHSRNASASKRSDIYSPSKQRALQFQQDSVNSLQYMSGGLSSEN